MKYLIILSIALIGCNSSKIDEENAPGAADYYCLKGVLYVTKYGNSAYTLMLDTNLKPIKCEETK